MDGGNAKEEAAVSIQQVHQFTGLPVLVGGLYGLDGEEEEEEDIDEDVNFGLLDALFSLPPV